MLVDSKQKELQPQEIILEATTQTKSEYTPDQVLASVMVEVREPGVVLMQEGNTLYISHKCKDRVAYARALNADIAQNYVENTIIYCKAMYLAGYDALVVDFNDKTILNLFNAMVSNKNRQKINPDKDGKPTVGYVVKDISTGYRVTFTMGPKRTGQVK
jgi:hypothetical protein